MSTSCAPSGLPNVGVRFARLEPEDDVGAGVVDLERWMSKAPAWKFARRRVGVVAGAVVVVIRVGDVEDQGARHEVEQDRALDWAVPPVGLTATTLRTLVPPVTATSMLNEPSAAAAVEAMVVAEFASVLVAAT